MKLLSCVGIQVPAYFLNQLLHLLLYVVQPLGKQPTDKKYRKAPFALMVILAVIMFPAFAIAQVTGTVTDDKGDPMADVSVQVQGKSEGATTSKDGKYSISVENMNGVLIFSYVGYAAQEIAIGGRTTINVTMVADSRELSDVVVVGYGKQKKVNLVGSVSTVNVDEKMQSRALPNISAGLSGLVPGLAATQSSGMAGRNNATLLIRGLGTPNNANPLVVVDGMPDVDINRININDIETISVLKDATSASVYGSRAANGVILITTKSGKGMKRTALTFTSNMALEKPTKAFGFMADYPRALTLHQRAASTNTLPSGYLFRNGTIDQWLALGMIDPLRYPNTDWWDVILRDGAFQNYNVSAAGGDEKANFFISVGLKDEQGLQINNDYKQYNARFNFDYKLRSNMNAGVRFNGNWSKFVYALEEGFTDPDATNTAGFDMQYAIAGITPYDPVSGYFGGVMAYNEDAQAYNPYTVYVNSLTNTNRQEANGSMYFDWTPVKGLTATIDYALNYYNQFRLNANMPNHAYNFQTASFGGRVYVGPNAGVANATNTGYKTLMNTRLNYHTVLGTNHDISALLVYSEEYWNDRFQSGSRNDRLHPSLSEIDAALPDIQTTGGNSSTEGLHSVIGRINYTAFNKYLLEANFRTDGSSKFLPGNQYGFFPSVAFGWKFTEEAFLAPVTQGILTNGKLRFSYGSLGNNSSVGRYEQLPTLAGNTYMIDGNIVRGFVNRKMINPFLTWETTTVFNAGLDLGFLNNRLSATFDFYDRLTTDLIRQSDMSDFLRGAYDPPRRNIGKLRNRGIEGDVSWKDRVGNLNYGISVNASYNRSNLEEWNEFLNRGPLFLNMPYRFVYTYETEGIAQTWQQIYNTTPQGARPGDILRKDLNGDGRITGDDQKAYPKYQRDRPTTYFAFNSFVNWKGIDVAIFFLGSAGRKDYWINAFNNTNFGTQRYASTWDHWTKPWSVENREGDWPRLGGAGSNRDETSFWLDDMSYLRLKNVQLGYSFPKSVLQRIHATNLRIAGSAENLATFTSFRGLDPEKAGNNNNLYPLNKAYSLAIILGF